jgi:hypothetical protein
MFNFKVIYQCQHQTPINLILKDRKYLRIILDFFSKANHNKDYSVVKTFKAAHKVAFYFISPLRQLFPSLFPSSHIEMAFNAFQVVKRSL